MHQAGDRCLIKDTLDNFTIVHSNGMHRMRVHVCQCSLGINVDRYTQLFRARLWPATPDNPVMATTFEALDDFSRLSLLGRLTAYDYHKALAAATDGFGILGWPVSFQL